MTDTEEELRRMLTRRADQVHSHLSGPAIRARAATRPRRFAALLSAGPRRGTLRRFAPLISAAAVLAVVTVSLFLIPHGPTTSDPGRAPSLVPVTPTSTVTTTTPPVRSSTTKPESTTTTTTTTSPSSSVSSTRTVTSGAGN
ncbi:hypothetical protein ACQPZF_00465 [Actinosynnema sp. CS-041913]|uniref:hypothetical protein n=1 Tax=Actinosynnema sp. CS-041913 TaxID=3239917 RepID=UPI003D8F5948